MADSLLDVLTKGGHSRSLQESEAVSAPRGRGDVSRSGLSHQYYETMGLTSATAEVHSPEKTARPGWGPQAEDNGRKR